MYQISTATIKQKTDLSSISFPGVHGSQRGWAPWCTWGGAIGSEFGWSPLFYLMSLSFFSWHSFQLVQQTKFSHDNGRVDEQVHFLRPLLTSALVTAPWLRQPWGRATVGIRGHHRKHECRRKEGLGPRMELTLQWSCSLRESCNISEP